ncbi:MAG TPA: hypothetical protein VGW33_08820 [Terriglobia bacterium]|nr:hypothetical protein [Terriglobia bacterium]
MDVEKTIDFLLKEAARNEARWAKSDARLTRLERVVALNNRVVTRLVRYGVSLRSDVRRLDRAMATVNEKLAETDEKLAETNDKLNALIDTVDKMIRRNGGSAGRT